MAPELLEAAKDMLRHDDEKALIRLQQAVKMAEGAFNEYVIRDVPGGYAVISPKGRQVSGPHDEYITARIIRNRLNTYLAEKAPICEICEREPAQMFESTCGWCSEE